MKIIHFADVHYDERNHDEIKKCMDHMLMKAHDIKPDVFICSGDVTNSQYLGADTKSLKTISAQFRAMSNIAPVAVICGTPSHDGQTPAILENVSGKHRIWVSTTIEQLYLVRDDGKEDAVWRIEPNQILEDDEILLVVSQIPAPTKEHWKNRQGVETDNENISQAMGAIFTGLGYRAKEHFPDTPHVLNGHFSMVGSMISATQMLPGGDIAMGKDVLAMSNADLYCLGHIHMRQEYQITNTAKAFHSGSIFRKDFGEKDEVKGFYIHTLDGTNPHSSEFIKTPTRVMAQIDYDLIKEPWHLENKDMDFPEIIHLVMKAYAEIGGWIKIKVTTWMDEIRQINQSKIKRLLFDAGAGNVLVEIDRVRRENSREDEIIRANTLPQKFEALAKHRSQPLPDGVAGKLLKVEILNQADLINYAKEAIQCQN